MPQLTVRGVSSETLVQASRELIQELAQICECGTDNFTLDYLPVVSVFGGEVVQTFPFVEVAWFDRGQHVQDKLAAALTRHLQQAGVADVEVAFKVYKETAYYINGQPCGTDE